MPKEPLETTSASAVTSYFALLVQLYQKVVSSRAASIVIQVL